MKKIIIFVLVITLFILWYFFAPIKWTFGLRAPRNFKECTENGGVMDMLRNGGQRTCSWGDKNFVDKSFVSPFNQ